MIYIISGTNRKGSKTFELAKIVQKEFNSLGKETQIIDLCDLPLDTLHLANYGSEVHSDIGNVVRNLGQAEGIYIITPEYNGSFPGILKYFIDHFSYPETFEYRPIAFTGLGGRFGGLRPVEHLQQVFNYRNAFVYPVRAFIINAPQVIANGELNDTAYMKLIQKQANGFIKFIDALKSQGLDANSVNSTKTK